MHAARFAGLDDDARLQARPFADEMMVHGPGRKQGGNRHATRAGTSVGEDENVRAGCKRDIRLCTNSFDRGLETVGAVGRRPRRVDRPRLEDLGLDAPQLLELAVEQDGVVDDELSRVLRCLVEQVALGADAGANAHDDRLADRVDRRVRHLREQLLEVRVEQRLAGGEHRERRVAAHRADRLLRVARERRQHRLHVLLRVAEQQLAAAERLDRRLDRRSRRKLREPQLLALGPLGVRAARRDCVLGLFVGDDPALREVDEEELPGLQPSLAHDVRRAVVEHARLRREHDPAVGRLVPAPGTQAVAVERRADHAAVGERDRCRAVPRLHQALVEGVEAAQLGRHVVAPFVRLRDHHHQRVRQRPSGEHEQLEHVVEGRRVGAARTDDRQHLLRGRRRRARMRAATLARASSCCCRGAC